MRNFLWCIVSASIWTLQHSTVNATEPTPPIFEPALLQDQAFLIALYIDYTPGGFAEDVMDAAVVYLKTHSKLLEHHIPMLPALYAKHCTKAFPEQFVGYGDVCDGPDLQPYAGCVSLVDSMSAAVHCQFYKCPPGPLRNAMSRAFSLASSPDLSMLIPSLSKDFMYFPDQWPVDVFPLCEEDGGEFAHVTVIRNIVRMQYELNLHCATATFSAKCLSHRHFAEFLTGAPDFRKMGFLFLLDRYASPSADRYEYVRFPCAWNSFSHFLTHLFPLRSAEALRSPGHDRQILQLLIESNPAILAGDDWYEHEAVPLIKTMIAEAFLNEFLTSPFKNLACVKEKNNISSVSHCYAKFKTVLHWSFNVLHSNDATSLKAISYYWLFKHSTKEYPVVNYQPINLSIRPANPLNISPHWTSFIRDRALAIYKVSDVNCLITYVHGMFSLPITRGMVGGITCGMSCLETFFAIMVSGTFSVKGLGIIDDLHYLSRSSLVGNDLNASHATNLVLSLASPDSIACQYKTHERIAMKLYRCLTRNYTLASTRSQYCKRVRDKLSKHPKAILNGKIVKLMFYLFSGMGSFSSITDNTRIIYEAFSAHLFPVEASRIAYLISLQNVAEILLSHKSLDRWLPGEFGFLFDEYIRYDVDESDPRSFLHILKSTACLELLKGADKSDYYRIAPLALGSLEHGGLNLTLVLDIIGVQREQFDQLLQNRQKDIPVKQHILNELLLRAKEQTKFTNVKFLVPPRDWISKKGALAFAKFFEVVNTFPSKFVVDAFLAILGEEIEIANQNRMLEFLVFASHNLIKKIFVAVVNRQVACTGRLMKLIWNQGHGLPALLDHEFVIFMSTLLDSPKYVHYLRSLGDKISAEIGLVHQATSSLLVIQNGSVDIPLTITLMRCIKNATLKEGLPKLRVDFIAALYNFFGQRERVVTVCQQIFTGEHFETNTLLTLVNIYNPGFQYIYHITKHMLSASLVDSYNKGSYVSIKEAGCEHCLMIGKGTTFIELYVLMIHYTKDISILTVDAKIVPPSLDIVPDRYFVIARHPFAAEREMIIREIEKFVKIDSS